jgi:Predicted glycosyltransferases
MDGSKQCFENLEDIKYIYSEFNIGFGNANNLGAKMAKGDYLLFLNSDTRLLNNAVAIFLNYMRNSSDRIGVLGCWLTDKCGNLNSSFGCFPSAGYEIRCLINSIMKRSQHKRIPVKDVDFVVGADMFIKRSLFYDVGGFDKNIFMYYEETDLQFRLGRLGFVSRIIEGPEIMHLEGGSFKRKGLSYHKFMMSQESYNYYLRKNFNGMGYLQKKIPLCLIRMTIFFKAWDLSRKIKAYKLVLER